MNQVLGGTHEQLSQKGLAHEPSWQDVGEAELVPDPQINLGIFVQRTYWARECPHCKVPMWRYKAIQLQKCATCGVERTIIKIYSVALCIFCHHWHEVHYHAPR